MGVLLSLPCISGESNAPGSKGSPSLDLKNPGRGNQEAEGPISPG
jgi:hypothetical protein